MESENLDENKEYGLFQHYRYFKKGNNYHIYDVRAAETGEIKEVEDDQGNHTFLSFVEEQKEELLNYLKEINRTRLTLWRQKTCGCNIKYCNKSGVNHIYLNETQLIGTYCNFCFNRIKGYFPDATIKQFPLFGSPERIAQEITERLRENGITAVQTRDNGVKFTIPEEDFNREEIISVLQEI